MYSIIFPPRPKGSVPSTELMRFERLGAYLVDLKYQGSRAIIHFPDCKIYSRHGEPFKSYVMPKRMQDELLALPGLPKDKEVWLDGEILTKTIPQDTKGKLVLFDVLQYGKYLFLKPDLEERKKLLDEICGHPTEYDPWRGMALKVSDNIMMAEPHYSNFEKLFNTDYGDEVHGLVLKKKKSVIDNFGQKEYLVDWLIRCRHADKKHPF